MIFWILTGLFIFIFSPAFLNWIPDRKLATPKKPSSKEIMKGAEPLKKTGKSPYAFILVHGYNDSPFQVRPLADHLIRKGHSVFAPLLDGHGTQVEDLINVRYFHWYQTVTEAVNEAIKKKKKVC